MTDWYVKPEENGGVPAGSGTQADPWNGFSNIDWTEIPGHVLNLGNGDTFAEQLVIGESGTPGSPVTIAGNGSTIRGWSQVSGAWSGPDVNGEWSITPSNDVGSGSTPVMLFRGTPGPTTVINKDGTVGSLASGFWQESGGDLYIADDPGSDTFYVVFNDDGITGGSNTPRDYIDLSDVMASFWKNCLHYERDSEASPTDGWDNCTIDGCTFTWASQSNAWVEMGDALSFTNNTVQYSGSTAVSFGALLSSQRTTVDNFTIIGNTIADTVYWDTDTNLEGHALDIMDTTDGATVRQNSFLRHGYYAGNTEYPGDPSGTNQPAIAVSCDGVTNLTLERNLFQDNYTGCLTVGNSSVGAATGIVVASNLFVNNMRFLTVGATGTVGLNILNAQFSGANVDARIANNLFRGNGTSLRYGGARPAAIYALVSNAGALTGPDVYNNQFDKNNLLADVEIRNFGAGGLDFNLDHNAYFGTDSTYSVWVETTSTYQVDSQADWETLQGAGYEVNGRYQVDPSLDANHSPHDRTLVAAGVKVPGVDVGYDGIWFQPEPTIGPFEMFRRLMVVAARGGQTIRRPQR